VDDLGARERLAAGVGVPGEATGKRINYRGPRWAIGRGLAGDMGGGAIKEGTEETAGLRLSSADVGAGGGRGIVAAAGALINGLEEVEGRRVLDVAVQAGEN